MSEDWRERYLLHAKLSVYKRRVDRAREVLQQAGKMGPIVVSISWGKDSIAMADMALDTLGAVPLCNMPGTRDLPGKDHVVRHFESRTIVHRVPSQGGLDHMAWCKLEGLAHERGRSKQTAIVTQQKRQPGRQWCRDHGFVVQCLGLRAEESKGRWVNARAHGLIYPVDHGTLHVAIPLAWWTSADVWAWIATRDLPYPDLYDRETHGQTRETLRNTGWLATDGAHEGRIAWLRHHYPDQYRMLAAEFPRVATLA